MDAPPSDAARERLAPDARHGALSWQALACRSLSAVWEETRAAFGTASLVLLASGVAAGVGYLIDATGFEGATLSLTSDFVAWHTVGAFQFPAYLVAIHCSGEIAHRRAGATNTLVAAKALAMCVAVTVALTVFLIAAVGMQVASGERVIDFSLCAYAIYVNFGWHLLLLGLVSMALQLLLANALRISTVNVNPASHSKRSGKWIVAAVFLFAWAVEGGETPFGPSPAQYSGMNGYGHHLERFYASGLYWTALATLLVLVADAWTRHDGPARRRWRLPASVLNLGMPTLVIWIATGCWISLNAVEPRANESDWRQEHEQRARSGVPHVVAWGIAVDIHPVRRRLESRGSALLANGGAESARELTLFVPRGAQVARIDIPNTSLLEANPGLGRYRYAFARPLRPRERVRMHFELAWEEGGFGPGERARIIENGTFLESGDVVPSFGPDPEPAGEALPATRIRTVIGTSLDQVAIGPGTLVREWKENARRYFEYVRSPRASRLASGRSRSSFAIHSGRYAVARGHWNDATIEVFHHPGHERNVDAMFRCARETLEKLTPGSSLDPGALLRVIEFPYAGEARVFPDSILFSEQREFAYDVRDARGVEALCERVESAVRN